MPFTKSEHMLVKRPHTPDEMEESRSASYVRHRADLELFITNHGLKAVLLAIAGITQREISDIEHRRKETGLRIEDRRLESRSNVLSIVQQRIRSIEVATPGSAWPGRFR